MSALLLSSLLLFGLETAVHCTSVTSNLIADIVAERQIGIIFSPANIQHSMALLYLGADGTTAAEFQASLKFGKPKEVVKSFSKMFNKYLGKKKINFQIDTRLYLAEDLELAKSFKGYAESFNTQIMRVKFEVNDCNKQINQWVQQQTSDKIKDLITVHTKALLVNSIYFKAKWQHKFSNGHASNEHVLFGKHNDMKMVQLKLKDTKISMLFLKRDIEWPEDIIYYLSTDELTQLAKEMQKTKVTLKAPKFTIEFDTLFKSSKLGSIFNKAYFNNILAGNKPVAFSDFRHKSYIKVDEEGIEVASVTGTIPFSYYPNEKLQITQDEALFALMDEKTVYFVGHYVQFPVDMNSMTTTTTERFYEDQLK